MPCQHSANNAGPTKKPAANHRAILADAFNQVANAKFVWFAYHSIPA